MSIAAALAALFVALSPARAQDVGGWQLETGNPTYAFIAPLSSDVDVSAVTLVCIDLGRSPVLQLELYSSGMLPLLPLGFDVQDLRADPHLQLSIDGRIYPVSMFFSEDRVIVADTTVEKMPAVSQSLLAALMTGHILRLRFQLLARHDDRRYRDYDGEALVDLQAGQGAGVLKAFQACQSASETPS